MDRITRIFSTDRTPGAPPPVNGSGPAPRKYANINGVMQLNPEYKRWMESQGKAATTAKRPDEALPVVSNMVEYFDMQEANMAAGKGDLPMAPEMIQAMNEMQDPKNCEKIGISPDAIVDALGDVLAKHEAPFGLISKLKLLSQYSALEFIVDDSGSMSLDSDTKNARGHTQSRWEEVRMRLKEMMEILAYIPAPPMRVRFLNRKNDVRIEHKGEAPEVFIERAHREIDKAFSSPPRGGTPIYNVLMRSFEEGRGKKISRYLFCDGCPNGQKAEIREIEKLCTSPTLRGDPQSNPITFLSCTGDDKEVEWMKELEERALFAAEYDDFDDEADEVHRDQGYALPFTKGFHLIGQLVGAMCPDDLDAMDESAPFTKSTLDSLLGVQMNEEDYRRYWEGFMRAQRSRTIESDLDRIKRDQNWEQHYHAFLTTPLARQIPAVIDFKRKLGVDVSALQAAPVQDTTPRYQLPSGGGYGQPSSQPTQGTYGNPAPSVNPYSSQNYAPQGYGNPAPSVNPYSSQTYAPQGYGGYQPAPSYNGPQGGYGGPVPHGQNMGYQPQPSYRQQGYAPQPSYGHYPSQPTQPASYTPSGSVQQGIPVAPPPPSNYPSHGYQPQGYPPQGGYGGKNGR